MNNKLALRIIRAMVNAIVNENLQPPTGTKITPWHIASEIRNILIKNNINEN